MKKRIIMFLTAAMSAICAQADTWTDSGTGYTWTYRINGDAAELYGGITRGTIWSAISPSPTGTVTILSKLGDKPVTRIGELAFYGCSGLTSVTIPNSVTSIGNGAFALCSGLTSVTIPNSVTSIGRGVFGGCTGLTSVTIPQCVCSSSMSFVFSDACSSITNVIISDGVTSIGSRAFAGCSRLTSMTIPSSVTSIGNGAFSGCSGLTSVTIPSGVTSIGGETFSGCSGLTSVTIPSSVTSIGSRAFAGCSGLTSMTIPSSVTSIGNGAFSGCSGLTSVTIPSSVTSIGGEAFSGCSGLTSVTIPNSVTSIGARAFAGCNGLTNVTIPSSVTSIGGEAFAGCSQLTSVTIPSSVTSIGRMAFYGTGLTTVHVEAGDTERVKSLLSGDWYYRHYVVSSITFVEDGVSSSGTSGTGTSGTGTSGTGTSGTGTSGTGTSGTGTSGTGTTVSGTPSYEVTEEEDIVSPYEVPKAVTLLGAVYDGDTVIGIVELKLGKVNTTKGTGRVSGSVTTLDGKRHMIQVFNLEGIDGTSPKAVSLEVKDFGTMSVTIGGTQFAGSMGEYHVQSATVGGNSAGSDTKVYVDVTSASLPTGALEDLLPDGEPVVVVNGKWTFAKAASVNWTKLKQDAALPERYDAESGKGLVVDTSGGKTNLSGMKLMYMPNKGTFKGSFKVYALEGEGKATKLKKYNVNVSGVVVGGIGYGTATCKNPAISWSVTVK